MSEQHENGMDPATRVAVERGAIKELEAQVQSPDDQAYVDQLKEENEAMAAKLIDPQDVSHKIARKIPKYRYFDAQGNLLTPSEVEEIRNNGDHSSPYEGGQR